MTFNWFALWISSRIAQYLWEMYINYRQMKLFEVDSPPPQIPRHQMDDDQFRKCCQYQHDRFSLHLIRLTVTYFVRIAFWCLNTPALIWLWTQPWVQENFVVSKHVKHLSNYDHLVQDFVQGLILIFIIYSIDVIIGLSFSAYKQFHVEEKAGFNKYTKCRWCKEVTKVVGAPYLYWPFGIACMMIFMYFFRDYFSIFSAACILVGGTCGFVIQQSQQHLRNYKSKANKELEMNENSLRKEIENLSKDVEYPMTCI